MATRPVQVNMKAHDASALGRFWGETLGWAIDIEEHVGTSLEPVGFTYPDPAAVCIDLITRPKPKVTDDHAVMRSAKAVGPYLEFTRSPAPKTVWNRVHLDVCPYPGDDLAAEEARLRTLGATDPGIDQSDLHWTVLLDPEGNEFCLLTPR